MLRRVFKYLFVAGAGVILSAAPVFADEYVVHPEDVLQIKVYEEPDLTTRARVTAKGEIAFPLLGNVTVAGFTVSQLENKLTELLAKNYLVSPQVSVFIEEYHRRQVFVTGSVKKPGAYDIPQEKPLTVFEALTLAGGFADEAAINGTKVIRKENGEDKTISVHAQDIMKGDKSKDIILMPSDIVYVPESFF